MAWIRKPKLGGTGQCQCLGAFTDWATPAFLDYRHDLASVAAGYDLALAASNRLQSLAQSNLQEQLATRLATADETWTVALAGADADWNWVDARRAATHALATADAEQTRWLAYSEAGRQFEAHEIDYYGSVAAREAANFVWTTEIAAADAEYELEGVISDGAYDVDVGVADRDHDQTLATIQYDTAVGLAGFEAADWIRSADAAGDWDVDGRQARRLRRACPVRLAVGKSDVVLIRSTCA